MAWEAWQIVLRDVQLVLLANAIAPGFFLLFNALIPTILFSVLAVGAVALFANWAPSLAAAEFLIFLPGIPFGVATGWLISNAFDHFRAPAVPEATDTGIASDTPAGGAPDARGLRPVHRLLMLGALLLVAALYVANVAVSMDALSLVLWLTAADSAVVLGAVWFAFRALGPWRVAWGIFALIYVSEIWIVTLILWLSESFFWTFLALAVASVVSMIFVYLSSVMTSHDLAASFRVTLQTMNSADPAGVPRTDAADDFTLLSPSVPQPAAPVGRAPMGAPAAAKGTFKPTDFF
jgi:hypothetical protein